MRVVGVFSYTFHCFLFFFFEWSRCIWSGFIFEMVVKGFAFCIKCEWHDMKNVIIFNIYRLIEWIVCTYLACLDTRALKWSQNQGLYVWKFFSKKINAHFDKMNYLIECASNMQLYIMSFPLSNGKYRTQFHLNFFVCVCIFITLYFWCLKSSAYTLDPHHWTISSKLICSNDRT